MAEDYEIHVGGIDEKADLIVDDILSAQINLTASALSDFTATVPKTPELRQYLQETVYFYNQSLNEVTWFGTLETWDESENGIETTISGRGPLLRDKQTNISQSFNSQFADDAIEQFRRNSIESFRFVSQDRDKRVEDSTLSDDEAAQDGYVGDSEVFTNVGVDFTEVSSDDSPNNVTYSGDHAHRLTGTTADTFDYTFEPNKEINDPNVTVYIRYNIGAGDSTDVTATISSQYSDTITLDNSASSEASHEWAQFKVGDVGPLNDGVSYDAEFSFSNTSISNFLDIDAVAVVDDSSDITVGSEQNNTYYINPSRYDSSPPDMVNEVQIASDEAFSDWEVYAKYENQTDSSIVGVGEFSSGADETSTISEGGDARGEYGHSDLTTGSAVEAPFVYVTPTPFVPETLTQSGERNGVTLTKLTVFTSESSQRYIINEEIEGSVLEGLQSLGEIAGYRFSPRNFDGNGDEVFILYPIGYDAAEPDWRIIDATRSTDFAGYANKVRVIGEYFDAGGRAKAIVSDDAEIDGVGRTIEKTVKRVDLTTDAECRSVAKTVLENSVQNRGESGSLTTTIPVAGTGGIVGADIPVSVWSDSFNDGGLVGTNALNFQKNPSETPWVKNDSWIDNESTYIFDMNVYAELNEMDRPAYLLSTDYESDFLVLYPDGHLEATNPVSGDGAFASTDAGVIQNETTHHIEIELSGNMEIRVDGNSVETFQDGSDDGYVISPEELYIGNRHRDSSRTNNDPYEVYNDTVLLATFDEESWNQTGGRVFRNYAQDTSVGDVVEQNNQWSHTTPADGAFREAVTTSSTSTNFSVSHDTRLDIGAGQFAVSCWYYVGGGSAYLARKGGLDNTTEGWNLQVDGNSPQLKVSDGSNDLTLSLDFDSDAGTGSIDTNDGWNHLALNIDTSDGSVRAVINGVEGLNSTYSLLDGSDITNSNRDLRILDGISGTSDIRLDELRVYNGKNLTESDIDTLSSQGPYYDEHLIGGLDEVIFRDGGTGETHHFAFDDETTPNTAIDSAGTSDASIQGVGFAATKAPLKEISYTFFGDAEADVKFDISGRVDTELANVRSNVENIKR